MSTQGHIVSTKGDILTELNSIGSNPCSSNNLYEVDVQGCLWFFLGERGLWNSPNCHCHDEWVHEIAFNFKQYAKKHWKGSFRNFQSAHRVWIATPIEPPERMECACIANEENQEVKFTVTFVTIYCVFQFAL